MTSQNNAFPVIDISPVSEYLKSNRTIDDFFTDQKITDVSHKLTDAFVEWGFVYLIGHGIEDDVITSAYQTSKEFFMLDRAIKEQFVRTNEGENWGWVPFNVETFEKTRPYDLKECFNFLPTSSKDLLIGEQLPQFMPMLIEFFNKCKQLALSTLNLLNMALPTEDRTFLVSKHQKIGSLGENASICRMLYYPGIDNKDGVLDKQLRCGEHSDYGTITLLFQDKGGLQVVNPHGDYVDATPIPGSIVVNAGDMLEIWSAGKFKATRHRVVVPDNDFNTARQSLTLFVHPDNDATVSCLDGSDKYPSTNGFEYLQRKFKATYL